MKNKDFLASQQHKDKKSNSFDNVSPFSKKKLSVKNAEIVGFTCYFDHKAL